MNNLSATESLKIIQSAIGLRKHKYEENGFYLLFWGILITFASISQYLIVKMGIPEKSKFIWLFTMIPGFIFSFIVGYIKAKKKVKKHKSPDKMGWLWAFSGLLAILNGFIFGKYFETSFIVILFLPFSITSMASAISIKNKLWVACSVLSTVLVYLSIYMLTYRSLVIALIVTILFTIPGINLHSNYKKNNYV